MGVQRKNWRMFVGRQNLQEAGRIGLFFLMLICHWLLLYPGRYVWLFVPDKRCSWILHGGTIPVVTSGESCGVTEVNSKSCNQKKMGFLESAGHAPSVAPAGLVPLDCQELCFWALRSVPKHLLRREFLDFNVHRDHSGTPLKYRFWLSRSGLGLGFLTSFPVMLRWIAHGPLWGAMFLIISTDRLFELARNLERKGNGSYKINQVLNSTLLVLKGQRKHPKKGGPENCFPSTHP